jgi:hypothetical protein
MSRCTWRCQTHEDLSTSYLLASTLKLERDNERAVSQLIDDSCDGQGQQNLVI